MSAEDRTKMREPAGGVKGRSMQDLSAEERTKVMQEVMAKTGRSPGAGRTAGAKPDPSKPEAAQAAGGPGGEGRRRRGQGGGGPGGPGGGGMPPMGGGSGRFTEDDLANAKLPPPPEQDSQLDVLLRPGLLADVEIIVEKIPNAIHIPAQAVFEKNGHLVVFVKEGRSLTPAASSSAAAANR